MPSNPQIECLALGKELRSGARTLTVLDAVDLAIEAGELVAILGPSGSGKSTLLGLMAGLDRPTRGSVRLLGEELGSLGEDELALLRRGRVGFVFQSFHLLGNLTALENVLVPLELTGQPGARERSLEVLERVGLSDRLEHYPSQLSGGEQQRVAVARAFAGRPAVLFADEPTGNLDSETGSRVLDLLLELQAADGTSLVLVTHDAQVAARADRQVHLFGGRVVRDERATPAS